MKKTKKFVVYKITNTINGMCYIGITGDYKKRIRNHFNFKNGFYLHNAINKYGKENFTHEIIWECNNWKKLCKEEVDYIKIFNTKFPNGYNLTDGGEGLSNPSEETRKKISKAKRNPSLETRKKMSKAHKNPSEEVRKKMSEAAKNRSRETCKKISEANKGHKASEETRKKISDAGRIFSKDQILEIRKMLLNKIIYKIIAKKFNVHGTTIGFIRRNENYADIQLPGIDLNNLPKESHKLSNDQILEIKKMLSEGILQKTIAQKFNVVHQTISRIKKNKR